MQICRDYLRWKTDVPCCVVKYVNIQEEIIYHASINFFEINTMEVFLAILFSYFIFGCVYFVLFYFSSLII